MRSRLPFRYLEPTFFSGLLDDPVLWLNVRPLGRSMMIDCGQIHHLAKRVLKSTDALFITHAHMDHFMGIDTFIRNVHVAPRTIDLFGPPGLAGKLTRKLHGYDWNLAEPSWCSFRVREIFPDRIRSFLLSGPEGFRCHAAGEEPRTGPRIYESDFLTVAAAQGDHKIPVLVYRITEAPAFEVDEGKIARLGWVTGPWLRALKKRFYRGELSGEPLTVPRKAGNEIVEEMVADVEGLYRAIRRDQSPASIGYLTDIGFTAENRRMAASLLEGVTLLICECSFLAEDADKARASFHLSAPDVNALIRELRPAFFLPMHLSKTYVHRSHQLYDQLQIPEGVTLLRLPDHRTPRPLLPAEAREIDRD